MGENTLQWLTFPRSLQHASDFDPKSNTVSSADGSNALAHIKPYVVLSAGTWRGQLTSPDQRRNGQCRIHCRGKAEKRDQVFTRFYQ